MNLFQNIELILQNSTFTFGFFFFILGCLLGSFFNVVILRYPLMIDRSNANDINEWLTEKKLDIPNGLTTLTEKIDLSFPASHCFSCKTPLKWYHNIPLFSYLFLRGKCGFCKAHISIQYPAVELLSGLILLSSYLYFIPQGLSIFLLGSFLFLSCFVLAAIDLKTFLLPDPLTYTVLWAGLFLTTQNVSIMHLNTAQAVYGALAGFLSLYTIATIGKLVKGQDVMGQGDFKLLAAMGIYIGLKGAIFAVFFSPFVGILTWLILKIFKNGGNTLPYGPSLIIGSIFYMIYGETFLRYLGIVI
jgi:leader peptidase (prepilin peptidase)/N-methyltransferase